jgi:lipopolysaccharide transport system permease protein
MKERIIENKKGLKRIDFLELFEYKEALFFFIWRDIKVKYKHCVLGILWALLQPLLTAVIFSFFLGRISSFSLGKIPYMLFSYSGLIFWMFFSQSILRTTHSVLSNSNLVKKIYFPRLIIPLASSLSPIIDFFSSFIIVVAMLFYWKISPSIDLVLLPILIVLLFLSSAGIGCWLSALNVKYRDVGILITFFMNLFMFVTPVIYPISLIPEKYLWLFYLNPMTGIIETFRSCIFESVKFPLYGFSCSILISIFLFVSGTYFYNHLETKFADII